MTALLPLPARDSPEYRKLIDRGAIAENVQDTVSEILEFVRAAGDRAIVELTERLDGVRLETTEVKRDEWQSALEALESRVREALAEMARRIQAVHQAQRFHEPAVDVAPGIRVWREWRPFERVGLYAPGGRTVYPSSVLMMAIPARLAGCREIVLCSPPQRDGRIAPVMLAAAALAGVTEMHAVGGAQAIAAMAYGTGQINRVDKIVGPGNAYVTAAKLQVVGEVAIDMPAGPSELVVISDGSADPAWLAADLQAQAEHSPDAIAVLVTSSSRDAAALEDLAGDQVKAFRAASVEDAIAFGNDFAPEHLMVACRDAQRWLPLVRSAGSVFLGPFAAAAAGDYATGANHVLPTGGAARSFGSLGVSDFGRAIQVQQIDESGVASAAAVTDVLADIENLQWHGASVRIRSSC
jgi:histidinol dehydrogenase